MKIFLLGRGIENSVSPKIHNEILKENNIGASYGLVDVEEKELDELIFLVKDRDLWGFNVTTPYKEKIIKYLDYCDDRVIALNACNTVVQREGKLYGYNTDVDGVRYACSDLFVDGGITILGRGGAARAAIYAFRDRALTIYARDDKKNEELKKIAPNVNIVNSLDDIRNGEAINVIQATNVGFNEDKSVIEGKLPGQLTFFDMIYSPWETKAMKILKSYGVEVKNGYDMVLGQSKICFKLFTEGRL